MLNFNNIIHDQRESGWQRPKTTRRYLHPPRSERMFTLWAEGKIVMGENHMGVDFNDYPKLYSSGIWIVQSRHARTMDHKKTKNSLPENGAPIHKIENFVGGFVIETEAFCNTLRKTTCFIRIRIKNTAPYLASEKFGLALRSGYEDQLIYGAPDEYVSYAPEVSGFKALPATFKRKNDYLFTDNDVFVKIKTALDLSFDENEGIIWFKPSLTSDESASIILAFGKGEIDDFHYYFERSQALAYWTNELSRINTLPQSLENDENSRKMIQNLVVQTLQCFSSYVDTNHTVLRQGGLQRLIWPWEAMLSITALARIGDFDDYLKDVFDFYYNDRQTSDGEVKPLGEGWAAVTSSAMFSISSYCRIRGDKETWNKYRDQVMLSFDWICQKRRESSDKDAVKGLFPPMRSCDWPQVFQNWCVTDAHAVIALKDLLETLEYFGDPALDTVKREYVDYQGCLLEIFNKVANNNPTATEIRVPLTPNGDDKFFVEEFYPNLFEATMVLALFDMLDPVVVDKLKARFVRTGLAKNGLYSRMPYPNGNTHVWYTSIADYDWFKIYHKLSKNAEAWEIINAQIRYSMTDEYYMIERFNDEDPYFVPWSPNVSAMGRLINMLLDCCE